VGQKAEKFLAAGVAAIRRKTEKSLHVGQCALVDAFARDALQVEIPAAGAVSEAHERNRHGPGMEPQVARLASPGPQAQQRSEKVGGASAA
jgi:hypothetical protein